ncbi:MAG: HAMP domain-containing sensor histidine kinase [Gemmatimonadales bacterium]
MQTDARILLIDDEEIVLDSCTEILRGEPYELATAVNGMRGLEQLREFRPDLVVVDLKMPGLSGFEVLERIHEVDPTIVPIVITGYATVSSAVEAMKRGAYDFLPKPFTPEEFRLIVRRGAEKRSLLLETIALRRERELLRDHFSAIVSHELKAPLAAIQQNLYALERELAPVATEDQRSRLGRVKARIGDLLQLIDTWRRGSVDLEAVKARFAAVPVKLPVEKAVESLSVHAARKEVEIVAAVAEPSPVVWGDQGTLTEVLVNILGNAVKYSREGGRVTVSAEAQGDEVRLSVADAGPGIVPEDLPHIFEAFYTAQPGAVGTAGERGSGLGLAVSRRIIEAHGGSIAVESTPGKGSTFTITLPVYRDDAPPAEGGGAAPVTAPAKEGRR